MVSEKQDIKNEGNISVEEQDNIESTILQEPTFDDLYSDVPKDPEALQKYLASKAKLRWSRVFIAGTVIGIVLSLLTLLIVYIISFYIEIIFLYLPWIYFILTGLIFIWSGCIGTMKQSFTLDRIRVKITKGEPISGADTKIAIGSAYTYIVSALIVGLASLFSWLAVR